MRADLTRLKRRIDSGRPEAAPSAGTPRTIRPTTLWLLTSGLLAILFLAGLFIASNRIRPAPSRVVTLHRLTDFRGLEEFPAISPDGKSTAFVAEVDGYRQVWIRLLAGGPPLRLTSDPRDHESPRWAPDIPPPSSTFRPAHPARRKELFGRLQRSEDHRGVCSRASEAAISALRGERSSSSAWLTRASSSWLHRAMARRSDGSPSFPPADANTSTPASPRMESGSPTSGLVASPRSKLRAPRCGNATRRGLLSPR